MRAVWLLALVACSTREAPIALKDVDQLDEDDRHELIKARGMISAARVHGEFSPAHVSFTLSHGGRAVSVVTKDILPVAFRDNNEATVTGRYVRAAEVRDALDAEGFPEISGDVFLARDVMVRLVFQF
ncbi:MAG: cytochrome c maturation protein CcmE [Kofleriaceae bacterium]